MTHANLSVPELVEHAIRRGEGMLCSRGALLVSTGGKTAYTGNRYLEHVGTRVPARDTGGTISPSEFEQLHQQITAHLEERDSYLQQCAVAANTAYAQSVRVHTERAWHSLFARNMYLHAPSADPDDRTINVLIAPGIRSLPGSPMPDEPFVAVSVPRRTILIGATEYAAEMKKAMFTLLSLILPPREVLPVQCAASMGQGNDVALFFGAPGAGKTTLVFDPERRLIGDDEHGWGPDGIFNFEKGCYAKCYGLSGDIEPLIDSALDFGAILENPGKERSERLADSPCARVGEGTRACYPVEAIEHAIHSGISGHPKNIFFLSRDASGVLPPISMLTPEQAVHHFVNGYSSKVAEEPFESPDTMFTPCYAGPWLTSDPLEQARVLARKMEMHSTRCWLVNTGWSGGPYGVGRRIPVDLTRTLVRAALSGALENVSCNVDPYFRFLVPVRCPGVSESLLDAQERWGDAVAYDKAARRLAKLFEANLALYK